MAKDTVGYLRKKKAEAPNADVSQVWTELEDLHSKRYAAWDITLGVNWSTFLSRLWHQLTQKLLTLVHHDIFQEGGLIDVSATHSKGLTPN